MDEPRILALHPAPFPRSEKVFLFLVGTLASTLLLKIAQIQYLEILYLLQIALLLIAFILRGYRATWFRPFLRLGWLYLLFAVGALALSIAALRFDFSYPPGTTALKYPVIITVVRIVELVADVSIMLYMADLFRLRPDKARYTMRIYFWTGFVSALYSLFSYALHIAGLHASGPTEESQRLHGFFNEGGPYGLYVLTLFLMGFALYKKGWESGRRMLFASAILTVVLALSSSKAALLAVPTLLLLHGLLSRSLSRRLTVLAGTAALILVGSQFINLGAQLQAYRRASLAYEQLSHGHAHDPNFVLGRVAGAFIVPRMVAAHPLTGIGWGNYGLLRNNPEYRGAAAWAFLYDDPALGLIGMAADFGLPLLAVLLLCVALPVIYLRRLRAPVFLLNLALVQPVANLFGAQLNLTYPWIVSSFALGLAYSMADSRSSQAGHLASPVILQTAVPDLQTAVPNLPLALPDF